ncbi:MAG: glutaredoxin family protein [Steroidobacteraceae bacterium]
MTEAWLLLGREDCGLCEEMLEALEALSQELVLPTIERADVDSDPEWQRRYGLKIPVLLWAGEPIATTRLDPDEIRRLLRKRR